jgi:multidrug resistance protein, MATE family
MKKILTDIYSIGLPSEQRPGETYSALCNYFYPELITSFILYCGLQVLDSFFIAHLKGTSAYATLGVTKTLFHFITKIAEGFSVGMVVLCGQYNSVEKFKQVGRAVVDAFWATCIIGAIIALCLYTGVYWIYSFYEVPQEMVELGVPFLRLRAVGVFLNFVFFALTGFLRGVKNTKVPMYLFILGALVFIFFDYTLVFGAWGFPRMEFQGSALASIIQYGVMLVGALTHIITHRDYRKYSIMLFSAVRWHTVRDLVHLSWPVMIDKASLAFCHIWLAKMVACMAKAGTLGGANVLASFVIIKDIEGIAILPGIAFAQVLTFLVSNDCRAHNWLGIKNNIKKIITLSCIFVGVILGMFTLCPRFFIKLIDKRGEFIDFAAPVMPVIGLLVFFDLIQLILSAALRGAADVRTVMWVRVIITLCYFMPFSYGLSLLPIENIVIKFILLCGSFYLGNAFMSIIYVNRLKSDAWKRQSIKGS